MELCVEPALWRPCSVVRAPRRADGADGADSGTGGGVTEEVVTEEVVVTLPPCSGHAESASAYVHVGFSRAVDTWVKLSAPPVESCFCKTYHWGGPRFAQVCAVPAG